MDAEWITQGTARTGCDGPPPSATADPPAHAAADGRIGSYPLPGPPPHGPTGGPSVGPLRSSAPALRPGPRRPCVGCTPSGPGDGPGGSDASTSGTHSAAAPPRSDPLGGVATPRHGVGTDRPGASRSACSN